MSPSVRTARVVSVERLSASVCSLKLELAGEPLRFTAGQWIHLHVPTPTGIEKRAYSIASGPDERLLEIAITYVPAGVVSPVLHALAPGAELACDGPHGFFSRSGDESLAPALFVGTGTGLCPLRSMLCEILSQPEHPPITLLFGVRTSADVLWREQLERFAARDPRFKLEVTLSRPEPSWRGRVGYVQVHVPELARELSTPHVYICGLQRMVGEVRSICKSELGLDRKRIHSERYD
jgi:CDP-4-dehydro-6-deoxyglucose reductase, E3